MPMRDSSGRFLPSKRNVGTSVVDLPKTTYQTIKFYQKKKILPSTFHHSIVLKLEKTPGRRGDKTNDGYTFYVPTTKEYPSIRPILNFQDKLSLVENHKIIYELLLQNSHVSIAQRKGWKYFHESTPYSYNNAPIKRIRSNISLNFIFVLLNTVGEVRTVIVSV